MTSRDARPPRIASLVPSLTELVFALGLGDRLVARTGFCIHPSERVGERRQGRRHQGRQPGQAAPAGADARAGQRRREPARDGRGDRRAGAMRRRRSSSPIRSIRTTTWRWSTSWRRRSPARPGVAERAAALRATLAAELAATRAEGRPERRVLYLIWHDPWMTVARDTYLSRMLARDRLADAARRDRRLRRRRALSGADRRRAVARRGRAGAAQLRAVRVQRRATSPRSQALCPAAQVLRVDGELLELVRRRAPSPGCATCARWRDDNAAPRARA